MPGVLHVPAFKDNYIWLIRGRGGDRVAVVDPGDAQPVIRELENRHLRPVAILCTHHHADHSGGIVELRTRFDIPVYGPAREDIDGVTHPVAGGDRIVLDALEHTYEVLEAPGHTRGHIAYVGQGAVFCGDTLFSGGCGRLFEGTAAQMWASLNRLAALPEDTAVYCAHEYTLANLRFARAVEPGNADLEAYWRQASAARAEDRPTLPSTIGLERRINPFLRVREPAVRAAAMARGDLKSDTDEAVFATLRRWKDGFQG